MGYKGEGCNEGPGDYIPGKKRGKNRGVGTSGTRSFPLPQMDENTGETACGGNPRQCQGC